MYSQSSKSFATVMLGASFAVLVTFCNAPAYADEGMRAAAGALDDVRQSTPAQPNANPADPQNKANTGWHPHLFKPDTNNSQAVNTGAAATENDIWKTAKPAQSPLDQILSQQRGADYYDHRASDILKEDEAAESADVSPIAKSYPDQFVVVCEANCRDRRGPQVVLVLPKAAPAETPPTLAPDPQVSVISCVGGCSSKDRNFAGIASPEMSGVESVGEWMTTVTQLPTGSKEPMPGPAFGAHKSGTGSSDWVAQINDDHAKSADAAKPEAAKREAVRPEAAKAEQATPAGPAAQAATSAAAPTAKNADIDARATAAAIAPAVAPAQAQATDAAAKAPDAAVAEETKSAAAIPAEPAAIETKSEKSTLAKAPAEPAAVESAVSAAITTDNLAKHIDEATSTKVIEHGVQPGKLAVAEGPSITAPAETAPTVPSSPAVIAVEPTAQPEAAKPPAAVGNRPSVSPEELKEAAQLAANSEPSEPTKPVAGAGSEPAATSADTAPVSAEAALSEPDEEQTVKTAAEIMLAELGKPTAHGAPATSAASEAAPVAKSLIISSDDPAMKVAIAKARAALPQFWEKFEKPAANEADFALKVAVADGDMIELVWMTHITRVDGKLEGTISNVPNTVKNVKAGQRYVFTEEHISDWQFKRNGKLVGNETMRTLLPQLPAGQAEAYRSLYVTP